MSSENSLALIEKRVSVLELDVAAMKARLAAPQTANPQPKGDTPPATAQELDSKYGNPAVYRDPPEKYWQGQSYAGFPLSQCSPEFLDALARYKDACAHMKEKDTANGDNVKKAGYDRREAARARGWALRLRSKPEEPADDIPF